MTLVLMVLLVQVLIVLGGRADCFYVMKPNWTPAERQHWLKLQAHIKCCDSPDCGCEQYHRLFDQWSEQLPLLQDESHAASKESWLWHQFSKSGKFRWVCVVCLDIRHRFLRRARAAPDKVDRCKLNNLKRHAMSPQHLKNVAKFLRLPEDSLITTEKLHAPSQILFEELYDQFCKGIATTAGFTLKSGIVARDKAQRMLWCLAESYAEVRRSIFKTAVVLNFKRDERMTRLHAKFTAVSADCEYHTGFFGQVRGGPGDAIGVNASTRRLYKDACTKYLNPPVGAAVKSEFLHEDFKHLCAITEALSVDSAPNEITAAQDMLSTDPVAIKLDLGFLPNCKWLLRDIPHSFRRILSRLWAADSIMEDVVGLFCHWRTSPSQLIQNSLDLRKLYKECCETSPDKAISTAFSHLRAAKHRIETWLKPMSRCLLDPTGLLSFCTQVIIIRKNKTEGKAMKTFLETVCLKIWLLAAMMADAAAETLCIIRLFDTENINLATMCQHINAFLDRITWLFFERGCFKIQGHVAWIMIWLKSRHFVLVDGIAKTIGGEAISETIIDGCLQHLQSWVRLAKSTLDAECPAYSLVSCFGVFNLPKNPQTATYVLSDCDEKRLRRLSQAFRKPHLQAQFKDHWNYAVRAFAASGFADDHWSCWNAACQNTSQVRGLLHASDELRYAVQRGQCFTPCTSGVESNFSRIDAIVGSRRLGAAESYEALSVSLLVQNFSVDQLADIAKRARVIYSQAFPQQTRTHTKHRIDKSIRNIKRKNEAKPHATLVTETEFLRRLHQDVLKSAPAGSASALETDDGNRLWTEAHVAEQNFQVQKNRKRKLEAYKQGLILPEECSAALTRQVAEETAKQNKSLRARASNLRRQTDHIADQLPARNELLRARLQIGSVASLPADWDTVYARLEMRDALTLQEATIHVCDNPWKASSLATFSAVLMGRWILTPSVVVGQRGAALKFSSALSKKRKVWVSESFQKQYPRAWLLLLECMTTHHNHTWRLLRTAEEFAAAKVDAIAQNLSAVVLALVSDEEEAAESRRHVLGFKSFLKFMQQPEKSSLGLSKLCND